MKKSCKPVIESRHAIGIEVYRRVSSVQFFQFSKKSHFFPILFFWQVPIFSIFGVKISLFFNNFVPIFLFSESHLPLDTLCTGDRAAFYLSVLAGQQELVLASSGNSPWRARTFSRHNSPNSRALADRSERTERL